VVRQLSFENQQAKCCRNQVPPQALAALVLLVLEGRLANHYRAVE